MKLPPKLKGHSGLEVFEEIELASYFTTKLSFRGSLIVAKSLSALKFLLPALCQDKIEYRLLGLGANQVPSNRDNFVFIKLKLPFDKNYLEKERELYHLPASVPLSLLVAHAKKFSLKGWEYMAGIPATVGGAAYMNAGINGGEFGQLVKRVYTVDMKGREKILEIEQGSYSYRKNHFIKAGEAIYAVDIVSHGHDLDVKNRITHYLEQRSKSQPWKEKTCGCVFKNVSKTCRAGHSIDILNIKGLGLGGVRVAHLHGNFFINEGSAISEDFIKLASIVQNELYLQFGKKFELEVQISK